MFKGKDLLGLRDLSKDSIMEILDEARSMKKRIDNPALRDHTLNKSSIVTLFYENSTRTKTSFCLAGAYLGGIVQDLGVSTSSVSKGESLIDTGLNIDKMGVKFMIIRHQMTGAAAVLARNVRACVINAGDGTNEHL